MKKTLFLAVFCLLAFNINAQIKIKELPPYNLASLDSSFLEISSTREIIPLRSGWLLYDLESPESKVSITTPSTFEGAESMVFEKEISFSDEQIVNNIILLNFLGINYSAEILINNKLIYKHPGTELPFSVELPKDILNFGIPNKLTINLNFSPNSESYIPFKSTFLAPQSFGGITRDIYLSLIPHVFIKNVSIENSINFQNNDFEIIVKLNVEKSEYAKLSTENNEFELSLILKDKQSGQLFSGKSKKINLNTNNRIEEKLTVLLKNAKLWSPEFPNTYTAIIELTQNSKRIDRLEKTLSIYKLENDDNGIKLNNSSFVFRGTTYLSSTNRVGNLVSYKQLNEDLVEIKNAGFNTVRFSKNIPHPYALTICENIGLLALLETPLNSIPESFIQDENFIKRSESFIRNFSSYFGKYNSVCAIGIGSSFLANSKLSENYIKKIDEVIKDNLKIYTYASFIGFQKSLIGELDFYGFELYSKNINVLKMIYQIQLIR